MTVPAFIHSSNMSKCCAVTGTLLDAEVLEINKTEMFTWQHGF
jgi:hypothetical protein